MTALLGEVADYLVRWGAWVVALVALAAVIALPARIVLRDRVALSTRGALLGAVTGAVVIASLAHRIGVDGPEVDVWRHGLPWAWILIGSALGVAVGAAREARRG